MNLYRAVLEYEQAKTWAGCAARRFADAKVRVREAEEETGMSIQDLPQLTESYAEKLRNIEAKLKQGPRTQNYAIRSHLQEGEIQELDRLLDGLEISHSYMLENAAAAKAIHGGKIFLLWNSVYIVPRFGIKIAGIALGTTLAGIVGGKVPEFLILTDTQLTPEEIQLASNTSSLLYAAIAGAVGLGTVCVSSTSKNPFSRVATTLEEHAAYIQRTCDKK